MENLFIYGTLHDPDVQMRLLGRTVTGIPTVLLNYTRNIDLFPPYPVAIADEEESINGWLLHITQEELLKLDEYEGENYIRIRVKLETGMQAWVYCASPILLEQSDTPPNNLDA